MNKGNGKKNGGPGKKIGTRYDQKPLPYEPKHIRAQMLMGMAVDPETRKVLKKKDVAAACGIRGDTLSKWIADPTRGGKERWRKEVARYTIEALQDDWPLLVRSMVKEALMGGKNVEAFKVLARLLGKLGPDVSQSLKLGVSSGSGDSPIGATVVIEDEGVALPDNGR